MFKNFLYFLGYLKIYQNSNKNKKNQESKYITKGILFPDIRTAKLINKNSEKADAKLEAMESAGIIVTKNPARLGVTLKQSL